MDEETKGRDTAHVSRRDFIKGVGIMGSAVAGTGAAVLDREAEAAPGVGGETLSGNVDITLNVNGKNEMLTVEPRTTLVNALRTHMKPEDALTGAKVGCDRGSCGACTLQVNGKTVYGCMTLAVDARGKKITTVEGLAKGDKLTPVQLAMLEHDAYMCGFCTPGFVLAITALLKENPNPTEEDVRRGISGNLCRCGAYEGLIKAAMAAAKAQKG